MEKEATIEGGYVGDSREKTNKVYVYYMEVDARRVGVEREGERLEGEELLWEEELGAQRYYNALIELENARRVRLIEFATRLSGDDAKPIEALFDRLRRTRAVLEEIFERVRQYKVATRSRSIVPPFIDVYPHSRGWEILSRKSL